MTKPKRVKPGPPPVAQNRIEAKGGIDWVCERIVARDTMTGIAEQAEVSVPTLITWIEADPSRSARAREARLKTARLWDEQATREIEMATDAFSLSRAKELAHHYRWRASKIAPREYGDKLAVEGGDQPIQHNHSGEVTLSPADVYRQLKGGE